MHAFPSPQDEAEAMVLMNQQMVYESVGQKIKSDLYEGNAVVLFAYGLSGSGKTFTVFGPDAVDIPEVCRPITSLRVLRLLPYAVPSACCIFYVLVWQCVFGRRVSTSSGKQLIGLCLRACRLFCLRYSLSFILLEFGDEGYVGICHPVSQRTLSMRSFPYNVEAKAKMSHIALVQRYVRPETPTFIRTAVYIR